MIGLDRYANEITNLLNVCIWWNINSESIGSEDFILREFVGYILKGFASFSYKAVDFFLIKYFFVVLAWQIN